jgi:hypothetical protein
VKENFDRTLELEEKNSYRDIQRFRYVFKVQNVPCIGYVKHCKLLTYYLDQKD